MNRWVLATANPGKLAEFTRLLAPLGVEIVPQGDLGIPSAPEDAPTFVENAIAKARHASAHAGLPALADDSGLQVDALGGAPGVHSARYAGEHGDDEANNRRLLAEMEGHRERSASFICVLVFLRHAQDPRPLIFQGEWRGQILHAPQGEAGFGYDPLFLPEGLSLSSAQLDRDEKNRLSHRGRATAALLDWLTANPLRA